MANATLGLTLDGFVKASDEPTSSSQTSFRTSLSRHARKSKCVYNKRMFYSDCYDINLNAKERSTGWNDSKTRETIKQAIRSDERYRIGITKQIENDKISPSSWLTDTLVSTKANSNTSSNAIFLANSVITLTDASHSYAMFAT